MTRARRAAIREATPADHDAIRSIFAATVALGRPVLVDGLGAYADFSLDPYLHGPGSEVVVHVDDGVVNGYVIVCVDQVAFETIRRRAAVRYVAQIGWLAATGRLRGTAFRSIGTESPTVGTCTATRPSHRPRPTSTPTSFPGPGPRGPDGAWWTRPTTSWPGPDTGPGLPTAMPSPAAGPERSGVWEPSWSTPAPTEL